MSQDAVLGHVFSNKALLEEALTTPSFKMTSPGARDNQRLEFLGDAVLGLLATDWLYANSPSEEGDMSARRQHMVSASALCAAVAGKGFVAMLKRNKGAGELPETAKTVADAVEAVMGAAWLDGGMAAAKEVFDFLSLTDNARFGELDGNPKTALQHYTQSAKPPITPVYKVLKTSGTSDKPLFTIEVSAGSFGWAIGMGGSIKEAESNAAAVLLEAIGQAKKGERREVNFTIP